MNRRAFLKRGLLGGAVLGAAGLGLGLWPSLLERKPKRKLEVLDEKRFAVLAAIAARTVQAPGADPIEIAHRVDHTMSLQVPEVKNDFRDLLGLFENALAGLLFDGRPKPFTRLSPEAQDQVLANWRDSRLAVRRGGYKVLCKLTQAAHYADESAWAHCRYPGPPQISQAVPG